MQSAAVGHAAPTPTINTSFPVSTATRVEPHGPRRRRSTPLDWVVPAGLLTLSLVPVLAGMVRVHEIGTTDTVTADNARFLASPLPAVLHILGAGIYLPLGALQVSPAVFRRSPRWHRLAGRVLAPLGVLAALSALWMNQFYPRIQHDGPVLFFTRVVVGWGWVLSIVLGVAAVLRRDLAAHKAWMLRGYAIGMGAGTSVLTHLPLLLDPKLAAEWTRALCMAAGWVINLAVAEWVIRKSNTQRTGSMLAEAA